jgi:hypothetical protein
MILNNVLDLVDFWKRSEYDLGIIQFMICFLLAHMEYEGSLLLFFSLILIFLDILWRNNMIWVIFFRLSRADDVVRRNLFHAHSLPVKN